ncbi:MAG: YggS family pyridoxal phosphate-dependent enzyme [Clostridia bacterium]|nr:YggS family pyridoxal phosphate-dependent enzyme [Clostridia bacterium]
MQNAIIAIQNEIAAVKREYGLTQDVVIVGASKTVAPEKINELPKYGITIAGENRVQELLEKYDKVSGVEWHLIGALQTNKVKYIIDKVSLIHSLDRPSLADEIDRQAGKRGIKMQVLVEVNTGREESKSGVMPEDALEFMKYVVGKPNLILKGVMGVFPIGASDDLYVQLKQISDKAKELYGADILSAGMSNDYIKAIRYGSNMVRIGSAIFGKRDYK